MSSAYFLLEGAYSKESLQNSPDPVTEMKYPCLTSYPFISDFSGVHIDTTPLRTDYKDLTNSYPSRPCPYCGDRLVHGT